MTSTKATCSKCGQAAIISDIQLAVTVESPEERQVWLRAISEGIATFTCRMCQ